MSFRDPAIIAAFVAALAAIAAAVIAFLGSERAIRANVVSSNRQKWIDAIRDDVVEFLSAHETARPHHILGSTREESVVAAFEAMSKMTSLMNRIDLRLNPDEPAHKDFMALLVRMQDMEEPVDQLEKKVVRAAQDIFKTEWEVIKTGR